MKKFIDRFPVIFSVLVFAITMPVIWGATYPLLYKLPFYWASAIKYTLTFLAVIAICFAAYRKIPFTLQGKGLLKGLFTAGLVGLICAVMAFVFSYNTPDVTPSVSTVFGFVLYNLAIAFSEEFLFRGVIFTQMLDSWKNKKGFIWIAIIVSSVIFGLRHLLNLVTAPQVVITTIGQVLFTFMAGFYLCAVYLRTRNIWICIIIHF
ncbi:MAG: CPBP family intramembrane metalloprotease, partial [Clostridia bacterium]|nr:CPBP family intramembrane metalloprotease [Clostridia bacterium]